tara:strand:+ start:30 stop:647 length:618 start_codon:yes stop_codon:yes gene_type:complete
MARCSFFTLDVSFYDNEIWESIPDKDKSKCLSLDVILNGLVMRTYDIPTYDGEKQPPEVLRERGICIELPIPQKILSFKTISQCIGWRKPRIIEVMKLLVKYRVIFFRILKNNQVEIIHLKALYRLHPTQQKYFNRLGIKVNISDMEQINKINETLSEVDYMNADDSSQEEEESQRNDDFTNTKSIEEIKEENRKYMRERLSRLK